MLVNVKVKMLFRINVDSILSRGINFSFFERNDIKHITIQVRLPNLN